MKKPMASSSANRPQNESTKKKPAKQRSAERQRNADDARAPRVRSATQPQKFGPITRVSEPSESSTPICAAASPSEARYRLKYGAAAPT